MKIQIFTQFRQLQEWQHFQALDHFIYTHTHGNFFQSTVFFQFLENTQEYRPFLVVAMNDAGEITGSVIAVFQSNGSGLKSWFSRRCIIWGGPLVIENSIDTRPEIAKQIISALKNYANRRAIYMEFRNSFDTSDIRSAFTAHDLDYRAHLNYLVKTDELSAVQKRMSSSRVRQIKSSLKAGASIAEPRSEQDVLTFYSILENLYREKVKKPLPQLDLFLKIWKSPVCKFFIILYENEVIGGIVCPMYNNKVIYEWYICGLDNVAKNVHPSVLATWAPIEYGIQHGFEHFDFMGAGKPEEDYGVREFKARFGGDEVNYGRYHSILNKTLFKIGKVGLTIYQKIKA